MVLRWWSGLLFRSYLRWFVILWVGGKLANIFTAAYLKLPLFGFRPGTELLLCAIELLLLSIFIRRVNQDILVANLGIRLSTALAPLVIPHFALSGLVALAAR